MPLFCLMYLIAYIDRQNVSYAKLQMAEALGMSEAVYGLGAAVFFIGYFLLEAPANLVLSRVGARVWFTHIMATWGVITIALGFTNSPAMFTCSGSCWARPRRASSPACSTSSPSGIPRPIAPG